MLNIWQSKGLDVTADVGTTLAEFMIRTKYEDIPEDVLEFTKCLTLKTVAGMLVGANKPAGRKMTKFIKSRNLRDEAMVVGCGFRTALWESVLTNAFFARFEASNSTGSVINAKTVASANNTTPIIPSWKLPAITPMIRMM